MSLYTLTDGDRQSCKYFFSTGFDRNFLPVGIILVESLAKVMPDPYVFYVLCYDVETYETLHRLKLPNTHLIHGKDFEDLHPEVKALKSHRKIAEYYWTCKSTLLCDLHDGLNAQQFVSFLDADHYFFADPLPLFRECASSSIGMVEHQFAERYAESEKNTGKYNAGFCVFRGDEKARACLEWWRERTLEWCFDYTEDGKFGDQMYLNHWPDMFEGIHVIEHPGVAVAPWNINERNPGGGTGHFTIDGEPLILGHFHKFRSAGRGAFEPDLSGTYTFDSQVVLRIYREYAIALQTADDRIPENIYSFEVAVRRTVSAGELIRGLFARRFVLTSPFWLGWGLWKCMGWLSGFRTKDLLDKATLAFEGGDLHRARRLALQCMLRNPLRAFDKDVLYILFRRIESNR